MNLLALTVFFNLASALPMRPPDLGGSQQQLGFRLHPHEALAANGGISSIPDWNTTHLQARRLLALSTVGRLSTVFQPSPDTPHASAPASVAGSPIGLPEYISDCGREDDDILFPVVGAGNPVLLGLDFGTSFVNTAAGSNASIEIDWWDLYRRFPAKGEHGHGHDSDDPYRDSLAGKPRLALIGTIERIELVGRHGEHIREALERCYGAAHPDARLWFPGTADGGHSFYWAMLAVREAFWVGGFGDRAQIGWLNMDIWRTIGDGLSGVESGEMLGWRDVRLPGEE